MKNSQINALVKIAEAGSIRAAARQMNLSQSALTRAMRELEEEVGAELIMRSYRGVTFTPAGNAVLKRARLILETIDRALDEVRQITGGSGAKVTIGVTPVIATTLLPLIYRQFIQTMPDAELTLSEGLLTGIVPELLEGRLDFGVAIATQEELPQELVFNPLFDIDCCAAGRTGHPLSGQTNWTTLANGRWILNLTPGSSASYLLSWLDQQGLPKPERLVKCSSTLLMLEMMRRTDLIGFGPSLVLKDSLASAGLVTFDIEPAAPQISLGIVRVRGVPITPAAQFLETLFLRQAASASGSVNS